MQLLIKTLSKYILRSMESIKPIHPFYKFDIGGMVRIAKKKKTFEKRYTPNWTEELFVTDKQLYTTPVIYAIKDLKRRKYRM